MMIQMLHRQTWEPLFSVDIDATEETPEATQLGLAVRAACRSHMSLANVYLRGAILDDAQLVAVNFYNADLKSVCLHNANLEGANFGRARLDYADLSGADLTNANFSMASLYGADLQDAKLKCTSLIRTDLGLADWRGAGIEGLTEEFFRADYWSVLTQNRAAVPELIAALCRGDIPKESFGRLSQMIEKIRGTQANMTEVLRFCRPAELWFQLLHPGHKPGDDTGVGYAAGKVLEWTKQWCAFQT